MNTHKKGFIALISAIIISAILLLVAGETSFGAFYSRFNALDSYMKEASEADASGCVNIALLNVAENQNYAGGDIFNLSATDQCRIGAVASQGSQKTLEIQATSTSAVTNLLITINVTTSTIISWQEIPNF